LFLGVRGRQDIEAVAVEVTREQQGPHASQVISWHRSQSYDLQLHTALAL
jgi:hypothetical protein